MFKRLRRGRAGRVTSGGAPWDRAGPFAFIPDADGEGDAVRLRVMSLLTPSEVEQFGGLPNEAIMGQMVGPDTAEHRPEMFRVDIQFVEFMHFVIARWAPEEPGFADVAAAQQDGSVYVLDTRTPTPQGAVPGEDIIGEFYIRGGKVVPDAYHAEP